jgi:ABC-type transport system substrate-binding protein
VLRKIERVGCILILVCILTLPTTTVAQSTTASEDIQNGPHIDKVIYKYVGPRTEDQVLAFMADEIDLILGSMKLEEYATLDYDPGIGVYTAPGNAYWRIDINCRDAPLNWTDLRRAFAYAFDKTDVVSSIFGSLLTPHDSIVPSTSRFCIEEDLDWHYYTSRADIGNQILNDAGFEIDPVTGYRNDPNGNPMHIVIGYPPSSPDIGGCFAQAGADALASLHISAETNQEDFNSYLTPLHCGCGYDMLVYVEGFEGANLLGSEFWKVTSENLREDCYFINSTYDMYLEELLSKPSFYEVYEAAAQIQKLVHYNVPRLVICPFLVLQAYSTDRFTGLVEDITRGVSGIWSLCNMYNITGSPGGSVRIGFTSMPRSFNIYAAYPNCRPFFENLWPTLFSIGPNMELIPNIANSMIAERHADNLDVPDGHTRLTVDIVQNATWSDGVPLTAKDVVFTNIYELESGVFDNPAALELEGLVSVFAPTLYRVVIEYNSESYWHSFNQAVRKIIPKHIFVPGGIGYEGWEDWNPVLDSEEPYVTCGPFIMDEFTSTENTMELTMRRNPNYHYNASVLPEIEPETTTPTTTTEETFPYPTRLQRLAPSPLQLISMGISISSLIVIVNTIFHIIEHKRSENS